MTDSLPLASTSLVRDQRFSELPHSPAVCGTAVVRWSMSSRVRVLRCVGCVILRQANCQLVTPVACALYWGHCKQGKGKRTQLMLECNSVVIVVIGNTVKSSFTSVLQNTTSPHMIWQYVIITYNIVCPGSICRTKIINYKIFVRVRVRVTYFSYIHNKKRRHYQLV